MRILLLDDDLESLDSLSMALFAKGHESVEYNDSDSALNEFRPGRFDLVVTDLRMPGINGLEVLRRVRDFDPEIPIIIISAFADNENTAAARNEGAFAFFSKPLDLKRFFSVLADLELELSDKNKNISENGFMSASDPQTG